MPVITIDGLRGMNFWLMLAYDPPDVPEYTLTNADFVDLVRQKNGSPGVSSTIIAKAQLHSRMGLEGLGISAQLYFLAADQLYTTTVWLKEIPFSEFRSLFIAKFSDRIKALKEEPV